VIAAVAIEPLQPAARGAAARLLADYGLPVCDLADPAVALFTAGAPLAPDGVVGLEMHGEHGLLRSLAVRRGATGRGVGRALVAHVETVAQARGAHGLWLLTETADAFFARLGWISVARNTAPPSIAASRQFAGLCPATATCMRRTLERCPPTAVTIR
jgi:amino-acid N-acetyltransferase